MRAFLCLVAGSLFLSSDPLYGKTGGPPEAGNDRSTLELVGPWVGPAVAPEDLEGEVVLVMFWGIT